MLLQAFINRFLNEPPGASISDKSNNEATLARVKFPVSGNLFAITSSFVLTRNNSPDLRGIPVSAYGAVEAPESKVNYQAPPPHRSYSNASPIHNTCPYP